MKLMNETKNKTLLNDLRIAKSLTQRMKGLLGKKDISSDEALWIHSCNSIHTFFMGFAIDVLFLNRQMQIVKMKKNITPWRIVLPVLKAVSVIECSSGSIERWEKELGIQEGDFLNVGH